MAHVAQLTCLIAVLTHTRQVPRSRSYGAARGVTHCMVYDVAVCAVLATDNRPYIPYAHTQPIRPRVGRAEIHRRK